MQLRDSSGVMRIRGCPLLGRFWLSILVSCGSRRQHALLRSQACWY